MNATIKLEKKHFPVLLNELESIISPLYGGTFIDCTFGQGGYSKKILENSENKVIALDRDKEVLNQALSLKKKFGSKFNFYNLKFSEIISLSPKTDNLKGIIFDLGYSLNQINDLNRGISFKSKSKLNMKMGMNDFSAEDVINKLNQESLAKIIKSFGEEQKAKLIAKNIIQQRSKKNILTHDLVSIIDRAKGYKKAKIHNATKTFQALRIFVNKEISELIYGLINSFKLLPVGGIIVVVTFHSIEDKIVKYFFKNYSEIKNNSRYYPESNNKIKLLFKLANNKPIYPNQSEIKKNPPSRSAKLRYGIKIRESSDFNDFISKFESLLKIENLSNEL